MNALPRLLSMALTTGVALASLSVGGNAAFAAGDDSRTSAPPAAQQAPVDRNQRPEDAGHHHKPGEKHHEHSEHEDSPARHLPAKERPCKTTPQDVPGQGRSCRVAGGLWKVTLKDGFEMTTHGVDLPSASGSGALTSPPRAPRCAADGAPQHLAVIAYPYDRTPDETVSSMRSRIHAINGEIHASAVESGSPNGADLIFKCTSTGVVQVNVVRLNLYASQGTFANILSELRSRGYSSPGQKYVVWYDAAAAGTTALGQGSFVDDLTDGASNRNNTGNVFALAYNSSTSTLLHEIGHNHGAVQDGMPTSTGSWSVEQGAHCYEGYDVMCYNDGGGDDTGTITWNCLDRVHFDCRHDTYFDARIGYGQGGGAGSLIDTRWNAGDCYNRFIVNHVCGTTSGDTTAPTISVPTQNIKRLGAMTNGLVPVTYGWKVTDASSIASQSAWISVDGTWYEMSVPATSRAGTWMLTPGSTYRFAVRATDAAGNTSGFAYSASATVGAHQEGVAGVTLSSGWTGKAHTSAYGGAMATSGTYGTTSSFTFTGRAVAFVATRATNRGKAEIYIDGTLLTTIDTYAASTQWRRAVMTRAWGKVGTHTITIKVLGTSGRPWVDTDAFVTLR